MRLLGIKDWLSQYNYAVGDSVYVNTTRIGRCHTAHTSGVAFDPQYRTFLNNLTSEGLGSPIGVVTPGAKGDKYIDQEGPTVYTAFGLTDQDRIS